MIARSHSKSVAFSRPFALKGIDRTLPAGDYRVVTDEELIEGLSFPVYRRVATMIFVPAHAHQASSVEMVVVDPVDLQAAQDRDQAALQASTAGGAVSKSDTIDNRSEPRNGTTCTEGQRDAPYL
jgi:hypothetical protein